MLLHEPVVERAVEPPSTKEVVAAVQAAAAQLLAAMPRPGRDGRDGRDGTVVTKDVADERRPWRFVVHRNDYGLIDYIDATPL